MCNCSGKCGCNITQITKGEKGDNGLDGTNGTNGTNAFKFVKEFETDGTTEIIPYSEITACNPIPEGCYPTGTIYNEFVDYHVQLWQYSAEKSQWIFDTTLQFAIDVTTGDLNISFSEGGVYRVVILA